MSFSLRIKTSHFTDFRFYLIFMYKDIYIRAKDVKMI